MKYYVCKDKDGNLYTQGAQGFRPKEAITTIDKSLISKKLKIIDQPVLDLDGKEQLDLEGNVITEKVAVLDAEKQADHEKEKQDKEQARLLKEQEKQALKTKLKDHKGKVKNMKLGELAGVVEDILDHLNI